MAHISNIGSGLDYALLATWWNWAKTQSAGEWARCFNDGTDLGEVDISSGPAESATNYTRIYTEANHRHKGVIGTGAKVSNDLQWGIFMGYQYQRVEGMRIDCDAKAGGLYGIRFAWGIAMTAPVIIDSNLVVYTSGSASTGIAIQIWNSFADAQGIVTNNCVIGDGVSSSLGGISCISIGGPGVNPTGRFWMWNNTVTRTTWGMESYASGLKGYPTIYTYCENNLSFGTVAPSDFYFNLGAPNTYFYINNNCAGDNSLAAYGGTGNQGNIPLNLQVRDRATDLNLQQGSNAVGKGKDLSANFDNDALEEYGTGRNCRPRLEDAWSSGALSLSHRR